MKLKAESTIKGGIIETIVSIDSFGSAELSAEEEKDLFEDFKIIVDYGKILFSRAVTIDDHKNPYIVTTSESTQEPAEEPTQDIIVLKMPIGESYELDAYFQLKYAVDINDLEDEYKYYNAIPDNYCLAKCMCFVYENVIIDYIQEQFKTAKQHKDDFEGVRYYTI